MPLRLRLTSRRFAGRVLLVSLLVVRAAALAQCVGDCGGDGQVAINDLILGVNIALGLQPASACPAFQNAQGMVTVAQLVQGVNNALNGCPAESTPTSTATATATDTATSTPSAPATATAVASTPTSTATATAPATPSSTPADVTLRVGNPSGSAGEIVPVAVVVSTAGRAVVATQNDLAVTAAAPIRAAESGDADCTLQLAGGGSSFLASFLPRGCQDTGTCTTVRVVYARATGTIPDGAVLYTCNLDVRSDTPPGLVPLLCSNVRYVVDVQGQPQELPGLCTDGGVTVQ